MRVAIDKDSAENEWVITDGYQLNSKWCDQHDAPEWLVHEYLKAQVDLDRALSLIKKSPRVRLDVTDAAVVQ